MLNSGGTPGWLSQEPAMAAPVGFRPTSWDTVQQEFFDREDGFMAQVQREIGEPTE